MMSVKVLFDMQYYSVTYDEFCDYLLEEHSPSMDYLVDAINKHIEVTQKEFNFDLHKAKMYTVSDYISAFNAEKKYRGKEDSDSEEIRRILTVFMVGAHRMFTEGLPEYLGRELTEDDCYGITFALNCFADDLYEGRWEYEQG